MRWFWVLVLLASLGAVVMLARPREGAVQTERASVRPDQPVAARETHTDLKGTGSPADPYRISWPLMQSARDVNAPGEVRVSAELALLDGTSIEISGYLAPPVQAETTSELLVMQKRWDGCCIGTPPTPFDCIEVRLDAPVTMRGRHLIQYGTVRGVLRIEPFIAGKFLLGLYRIESGRVVGEIGQ